VATEGLAPGFIIGLREGVEAALVIGIILGYLLKIRRKDLNRYVYGGTVGAIFASAGVAGALFALAVDFENSGVEPLFEGFAIILAVSVLTSMIFWMMKASKNISVHVQQRIDSLLVGSQVFGLATLSFVMVFREGVETALLMFGAGAQTSPWEATTGVGIGLIIAGLLGVGIVRLSWRLPLKQFFQVTGMVLVVIAAGLLATAVHELQEGFGWVFGSSLLYDLSSAFPAGPENPLGYLLRGIVGYADQPTVLEAAAYVGYWILAAVVYLGIRTGKISAVTNPLRRVWRSITLGHVKAPADTE
jgi:high-affinity iron transporter